MITGFMIGNTCYDKDGVRAAAAFAELSVQLYNRGSSPYQQLQKLYKMYVPYCIVCV